MKKIVLPLTYINKIVKKALIEDVYPSGDITSNLVKNNKTIKVKLISRQQAIVAGLGFVKQTFSPNDFDQVTTIWILTNTGPCLPASI